MRRRTLARRVAAIADDKLGEDIVVLDMRELVSYTDFLVLVTARNERLAKAIADDVHLQLKGDGLLAFAHRGRAGGAVGASRLSRLRAPRLRSRGARALPARAAVGRGAAGRAVARSTRGTWASRGCVRPRRSIACRPSLRGLSRDRSSATGALTSTRRWRGATRRSRRRRSGRTTRWLAPICLRRGSTTRTSERRARELERASLDLAARVNALEQVADRLALRVVERDREIETLTLVLTRRWRSFACGSRRSRIEDDGRGNGGGGGCRLMCSTG